MSPTGRMLVGATSDGHVEVRIESVDGWGNGAVAWLTPANVKWLMKELIKHMPEDEPEERSTER